MILSFYCVRNNKGQFYKSDGYWVEELKKAKTYKNSGPARSIITKEFKKKNICELIQLPVLHMVVVDEGDRVQKVIEQQKKAELNRQLYYADFKPVMGIMTRYAKKMVNNRFYGKVLVQNLPVASPADIRIYTFHNGTFSKVGNGKTGRNKHKFTSPEEAVQQILSYKKYEIDYLVVEYTGNYKTKIIQTINH